MNNRKLRRNTNKKKKCRKKRNATENFLDRVSFRKRYDSQISFSIWFRFVNFSHPSLCLTLPNNFFLKTISPLSNSFPVRNIIFLARSRVFSIIISLLFLWAKPTVNNFKTFIYQKKKKRKKRKIFLCFFSPPYFSLFPRLFKKPFSHRPTMNLKGCLRTRFEN